MQVKRRKGISALFAGVLVASILAATGAGIYYASITGAFGTFQNTTNSSSESSSSSQSTSTSKTSSTNVSSQTTSQQTSSTTSTESTQASTSSSSSTTSVTTVSSTTVSCTATTTSSTTTSGGTTDLKVLLVDLFGNYSAMAVSYQATASGYTGNVTSQYHVLYSSTTTYKLNVTSVVNQTTTKYTIWVLKNGTALAVYTAGYYGSPRNYTGSQADAFYLTAMSAFTIETQFASPQVLDEFTSSELVHVVSNGVVMLGPTQVSVTTYSPSTLPLVVSSCGGSVDFEKYSIQVGTVAGKTLKLLTQLQIKGSFDFGSFSETVDLDLSMTSVST